MSLDNSVLVSGLRFWEVQVLVGVPLMNCSRPGFRPKVGALVPAASGALCLAAAADLAPPVPCSVGSYGPLASIPGVCAVASSATDWVGALELVSTLGGSVWTWWCGWGRQLWDAEVLRGLPDHKMSWFWCQWTFGLGFRSPWLTYTCRLASGLNFCLFSFQNLELAWNKLCAKLSSSLYGFSSALHYTNLIPINFGQRPTWVKERVDLRLSTQSEQNIVPSSVSLFMRMMGEMNIGLFPPLLYGCFS